MRPASRRALTAGTGWPTTAMVVGGWQDCARSWQGLVVVELHVAMLVVKAAEALEKSADRDCSGEVSLKVGVGGAVGVHAPQAVLKPVPVVAGLPNLRR